MIIINITEEIGLHKNDLKYVKWIPLNVVPKGILLCSVGKPEFIFVPCFLISGPDDMEFRRKDQTQAQGNWGVQ